MSKTLWDWMQLLLVPVMLAIGGFWLNQLQKKREESTAEQRDKTARDLATDNQREVALQSYIDKIGELLLREHEHLGASPGNSQIENIARARTTTVLRVLDPNRRTSLLRFLSRASILWVCTEGDLASIDLHETHLAQFGLSKFNLSRANLSGANLSGANLSGADLSYADFSRADLSRADLSGADLSYANLSGADLYWANLSSANLSVATLSSASLISADLSSANLSVATLSSANLSLANLSSANLDVAYLISANLSSADLSKASLSKADLSKADLSEADLSKADLNGANFRGADLSKADLNGANFRGADLREAMGLTDKQRADYQSKGAHVDSIPSTPLVRSTVSPPVSSMSQRDREQGQSPASAGDTTLPIQEEDTDTTSNDAAPPAQLDSPS